MNENATLGASSPRRQSVDESVRISHKVLHEIDSTIERIMGALTGEGQTAQAIPPEGGPLVYSAQRVAERLQSLVSDLNRIEQLVSPPKVESIGVAIGNAGGGVGSIYGNQNNAYRENY